MMMPKTGEEATPTEVTIDNHAIQNTEQIQLLGITLDNKLSFTHHLATVSRRTSRRIGVLMTLRKLIPTETKLHIYKSAVLPYFQYCSLVWHFCRASDRRKLEKNQRERTEGSVLWPEVNLRGVTWEGKTQNTIQSCAYKTLQYSCTKLKINYSLVRYLNCSKPKQQNTLLEMPILTFRDTTVPHLEF